MAEMVYANTISASQPATGRESTRRPANRRGMGKGASSVHHAVTTLAPEASSGRDARRFVQGALEDWGWPGPAAFQDLQDILLLTSELAINAAHHAHSTMEVTVHYWPGAKVKVEVHDEGEGMPRVHQPATFEESGRGLALVDLLSESWGVHSAALGKTVWFQLQLR